MQLLINKTSVSVGEIIDSCYEDEKVKLKSDYIKGALKLLGRVRSLISDLRKKLFKNGINENIISTLGQDISIKSEVFLYVNSINDMDKKHYENKSLKSYKPPEDIKELKEIHPDYSNGSIDENLSYDPDKFLYGLDDENND